jgi:hypothetical protein
MSLLETCRTDMFESVRWKVVQTHAVSYIRKTFLSHAEANYAVKIKPL